MQDYDMKLEPVLERELYTTPALMSVVVARIIGQKQDIPKAFRLTKELSTDGLSHLRRVRDFSSGEIECIITRCNWKGGPEQEENLRSIERKFSAENIFRDYRIVQVPSKAPVTDFQLKNCNGIWPCKFAKSTYLAQCLNGSAFSEAEKKVLEIIVKTVVDHVTKSSNKYESAATVFRYNKIYGVGLSSSDLIRTNPVKHSTMMAIDSVATEAGAGHWRCKAEDGLLNSIQKQLDSEDELAGHCIDSKFLPYLCSNYDIFVTEQPCFMCAMGLVQSRIRRLFYLDSETIKRLEILEPVCYPDLAIEHFYVHRDKSLNHRFEAWKINLVAKPDVIAKR